MVGLFPLPFRDPDTVLQAWGERTGSVFLDSGGDLTSRSRWRFFCMHPRHVVTVSSQGDIGVDQQIIGERDLTSCFDIMRAIERDYCASHDAGEIPFGGGWIGFVSYRFGLICNGLSSLGVGDKAPLLWSAFYDQVFVWDRLNQKTYLLSLSRDDISQRRAQLYQKAWLELPSAPVKKPNFKPLLLSPRVSRQDYCHKIQKTRAFIAQGAIFQANITQRHEGAIPKDFSALTLYRHQRRCVPAPFGAFLNCSSSYQLLSSSPESFLRVSPSGTMSTRPIKGTKGRGRNDEEDLHHIQALQKDEKERAENLMIVDLMRNDIGQLARFRSMAVSQLRVVESFSHVHHLVSEVRGKLKAGKDCYDLLARALPPGSVTGAPKIEAMKIIDQLEVTPRGAYCGSIFCKSVGGGMMSSVIIRTFERHHTTLSMGTGGGITFLSDPEAEYEEMLLKWAPFKKLLERA